ncbi:MAG: DEAD/DEAH box helicase family protein [Bdellovibrionales bacterium]|nr:DEAD/DEAH box helicase family protein [Bdellovibrionales bacterium]
MRIVRPILFLLLLLVSVAHAGIDPKKCQESYDAIAGDPSAPKHSVVRVVSEKGTAEMQNFLRNVLLPAVGMRALKSSPETHRSCKIDGDCMTLGNYGADFDLRIRFDPKATTPKITWEKNVRTLIVPEGYDFAVLNDGGRSLIRRFLIGHPLHPFVHSPVARAERLSLGEPPLFLKEVQEEGKAAAVHAVEDGQDSFLFVAPTGTGKTEVAKGVLETQLKKHIKNDGKKSKDTRRLQMVVAHENFLVDQLQGDVMDLVHSMKASGKYPGTDFIIVRWGEDQTDPKGHTETIHHDLSMEQVLDLAEKEGKQVILVSTIQSLQAKTGGPESVNSEFVRASLGTLVFDEAHHAGAPDTIPYLNFWLDRSKGSTAFLYGTTATPTHHEVDLINDLFNGRAYWAYLDTPENYRSGMARIERSVGEVVTQLENSINEGELTPFQSHFLDPDKVEQRLVAELGNRLPGDAQTSLFVDKKTLLPEDQQGGIADEDNFGNRRVLNPLHYKNVITMFEPLFLEHQRGFIATSSKDEAEAFTAALTEHFKGKKGRKPTFAYLHSYMSASDKKKVKDDFKAGKIDFLVTIRMMDEGVNVPDLTLFIDINENTPPRQLLQRIGRILRVNPGKQDPVDVVSFQKISDVEIADMLDRLNAIGRRAGTRKRDEDFDGEKEQGGGKDGEKDENDGHKPEGIDWQSAWRDQLGIVWTDVRIRQHLEDFFISPDRGEGAASKDLALLRAAFFAGKLNDLEKTGGDKIQAGGHSAYVRTIINSLIKRTDSRYRRAQGNQAFEAKLVLAEPALREWVRKFREDRLRRQELLKTPEGIVALLHEEAGKQGGAMSYATQKNLDEAERARIKNDDQIEFYQQLLNSKGNLLVLLAFEKAKNGNYKVRNYLFGDIDEKLRSSATVGRWVADFHKEFKRLPAAGEFGLEGRLAGELAKIQDGDLKRLVGHDPAVEAIRTEREASRLAEAATKAAEAKEQERKKLGPLPIGDNAPLLLRDPAARRRILEEVEKNLETLTKATRLNAELTKYVADLQTLRLQLLEYDSALKLHEEAVASKDPDLIMFGEQEVRAATKTLLTRENLQTLLVDPADLANPKPKKQQELTLVFSGRELAVNSLVDLYAVKGITGLQVAKAEVVSQTGFNSTVKIKFKGDPDLIDALRKETDIKHNVVHIEGGKPFTSTVQLQVDGEKVGAQTVIRKYNFGGSTVVSGGAGGSVTVGNDPYSFYNIFSPRSAPADMDAMMAQILQQVGK